jgi:hypothetical protein
MLISTVALLPSSNLFAQRSVNDRAAAIISVESVDDLLGDVSYLVGAAGFPEFVPMITFGAGEFIRGLDRTKPAGAWVTFDGEEPVVVAFVPVKKLDQVLDTLSNQGMSIEEDGEFEVIDGPGGRIYIIEENGYAFIAQDKGLLADLPQDPSELVAGLAQEYAIAAHVNVKNIPESLREQAIDAMKKAFDDAMQNVDNEDMADFQRVMNEASMQNMVSLIKDSKSILIGLSIESENKRTYFDLKLEAEDGSLMAKRIEKAASVESRFLAFLREGAALNLNYSAGILPADAKMALDVLKQGRSQIEKDLAKSDNLPQADKDTIQRLANGFLDVVEATLSGGKFDMGASVSLSQGDIEMIAGGHIADGQKMAGIVEEVLQVAKEKAGDEVELEIQQNKETFQGVKFHAISLTIPENERDEEFERFFPDGVMHFCVGVGEDAAYVGLGKNSIETIKAAMGGKGLSPKTSEGLKGKPSMRMEINAQSILKFAHDVMNDEDQDSKELIKKLIASLEDSGNGQLIYSSVLSNNSATTRFEIQEGLIRLIGVGAKNAGVFGGNEDF